MKVNPADKPKVIALVVAIVLIGGFGVFRFIGSKGSEATPPGQVADPNANLPTAATLAEGKFQNESQPGGNPDLASLFQGGSPTAATINPFRSPVPKPPQQTGANPGSPNVGLNSGAGMPPRQIGGDGFDPVKVNQSGGLTGPTVQSTQPMLVKGIISPEGEDSSGMAFIQVGDVTKGYRIGDTISQGIKLVGISKGMVVVRLGRREVKAPVGRELKFF
jgi:hypothetical protein